MMRSALLMLVFLVLAISASAMNISFFEEFPTPETMEKAKLIDSPPKLYLAAHNFSEFFAIQKQMKDWSQVSKVVYWPVLPTESYWISPWSEPEALQQVFQELRQRKDFSAIEVMLDLELPKKRTRLLSLQDALENKRLIASFLQDAPQYNISTSTIVTPFFPQPFLELMGLWYDPEQYGNHPIKMFYSSYRRHLLPDIIVDKMMGEQAQRAAQENARLGIGLIASGIHGDEPIYDASDLARELRIAESAGVREVIIFRLGGLTEEYAEAVNDLNNNN